MQHAVCATVANVVYVRPAYAFHANGSGQLLKSAKCCASRPAAEGNSKHGTRAAPLTGVGHKRPLAGRHQLLDGEVALAHAALPLEPRVLRRR